LRKAPGGAGVISKAELRRGRGGREKVKKCAKRGKGIGKDPRRGKT